jgi:DME family drug/metabolite transporter
MDTDLKGEICALAAALSWATALVLFKRSGERVPPIPLNLFKNVTALVLLVFTLLVMGASVDELRTFPVSDMAILSLSGFLGIAVADTTFFYALNLIGVGLVTIAECTYSPLIILFSILLLSESLTLPQNNRTVIILAALKLY